MTSPDRGGPVNGERSISGRACLPVMIVMMAGLATFVGGLSALVQAVI